MIQQLMFGEGGFNAQTSGGEFAYMPNPHGVLGTFTTLTYTAATMTAWFNNRSLALNSVPQSKYGTLTVNFGFTVPSGYDLYLVVDMSISMNPTYSSVALNGSNIKNGHTTGNFLVATAGTTINQLQFVGNVQYSGQNDGYVARVRNFVLVPTGTSVNASYKTEADFRTNVPGAIFTGA